MLPFQSPSEAGTSRQQLPLISVGDIGYLWGSSRAAKPTRMFPMFLPNSSGGANYCRQVLTCHASPGLMSGVVVANPWDTLSRGSRLPNTCFPIGVSFRSPSNYSTASTFPSCAQNAQIPRIKTSNPSGPRLMPRKISRGQPHGIRAKGIPGIGPGLRPEGVRSSAG